MELSEVGRTRICFERRVNKIYSQMSIWYGRKGSTESDYGDLILG